MSDDPEMDRFRGPSDGVPIRSVGPRPRRPDPVWEAAQRRGHEERVAATGRCGREDRCPVCLGTRGARHE